MSDSALSHRLAAILAADAAGYSRLMAVDDQTTVAALDAARTVFRVQIEAQHGRVIDMAGDSVLAVFGTAAGAVAAAPAIQSQVNALADAEPGHRRMRFRIGVHLRALIGSLNVFARSLQHRFTCSPAVVVAASFVRHGPCPT